MNVHIDWYLPAGAFIGGFLVYIMIKIYKWLKGHKLEKHHKTAQLFEDQFFGFDYMLALQVAPYQAADIGECLHVSKTVRSGDIDSWFDAWVALAARIDAIAHDCNQHRHFESAKSAYLRACNYYAIAERVLPPAAEDPRMLPAYKKSIACFNAYVDLSQPMIERISIAYEETTLPGYFYRVANDNKSRPTIIIETGMDGLQERLVGVASEAVKRGYNAVTFEGPGQGAVIRLQQMPFRPDWEHVVTPVIDYLAQRTDVDINKLALYGLSFAGYLSARAASADHRIKALIVNGGIIDMLENSMKHYHVTVKQDYVDYVHSHRDEINKSIYLRMSKNLNERRSFDRGMYVFQAESPAAYVLKLAEYSMYGRVKSIRCPTLVMDGELEFKELVGQSRKFYDLLACPKEYILFKISEGAALHCQAGAQLLSNQRLFDWLDTTFAQ